MLEAKNADDVVVAGKERVSRWFGKKGLTASQQKAIRTLEKHVEKLPNLRYKSQVKGTIYRVKQQIDTIKQFIKDKGL